MTVRLVESPPPPQLPEFVLWTMAKDGRQVECRIRIVCGRSEIRVLMTRTDGTFDLLWSEMSVNVRELAQEAQRRFEVRGWELVRVAAYEPKARA